MELHTKIHIEGHSLNANGTLKGASVFDYADVTAFSIINDKFTRFHKHIGVVTSSAKCKFLAPYLVMDLLNALQKLQIVRLQE